jgi:hypothetical protein
LAGYKQLEFITVMARSLGGGLLSVTRASVNAYGGLAFRLLGRNDAFIIFLHTYTETSKHTKVKVE